MGGEGGGGEGARGVIILEMMRSQLHPTVHTASADEEGGPVQSPMSAEPLFDEQPQPRHRQTTHNLTVGAGAVWLRSGEWVWFRAA